MAGSGSPNPLAFPAAPARPSPEPTGADSAPARPTPPASPAEPDATPGAGAKSGHDLAGPVAVALPARTTDEGPDGPDGPRASDVPSDTTLVIEGNVIPRRLRRPWDLFRLVLVLLGSAAVFTTAYFATATTSGIDKDISGGITKIPGWLLSIAEVIGVLGILGLPIAVAVDLLLRRRGRQLLEALGAMVLTLFLVSLLIWLINKNPGTDGRVLIALTGRNQPSEVPPLNAIISGLVAFTTVTRLVERPRWGIISTIVIAAVSLANIVSAGMTATAVVLSLLIGWALGLLVRYALGTPTTRPTGTAVAAALDGAGYPLTVLRARHETEGGRRYSATTARGQRLEVLVLDRDLEGSGLIPAAWRQLRIREETGTTAFSMRRRLDRAALQSYASKHAGAPVPDLVAVAEVGPDAALLAFERVDGRTFASVGPDLTDENMSAAWRGVRTLHDARISHRSLSAEHLMLGPDDTVTLLDPEDGAIAASDLAERLDLAELLATLALLTSPERALATGQDVMGVQRLAKALPVLQPVALSPETRRAVRKRKDVMTALRDGLLESAPEMESQQIEFERLKPKTVLTIIAGTVAVYLVLSQLAKVNLQELASQANWGWVVPGILLSSITYVGAAMSLEGFVPERLSFIRTFMAQLAASFATLVSPPTLGAVAINVRYLQRAGLHPALAAASVGVSQVIAFVVHLGLMTITALIAGSQLAHDAEVLPRWAVFVIIGLAALVVLALVLPFTRRWAVNRVKPILSQVIPRLISVAQKPLKLITGIGGILLLNLAYCACLVVCVKAFGGEASIAAISLVYLAGSTVGQAAPTPGGLGAVEAAMSAGLTAAGVDAGVAVSSVLLFRLLTFWLPTIPGWVSFNRLQKEGAL